MTTNNHTPITPGAAANAAVVNAPIGELDAAIGNLSSLATTSKTSAVVAINEIVNTIIAPRSGLSTTDKASIVAAVNEVFARLATSTNTDGTLKSGLITNLMLSSDVKIGSLAELYEPSADVVEALNSLKTAIDNIWNYIDPYGYRPVSPIVPTLGTELLADPGLEGVYNSGLNVALTKANSNAAQSADVHGGSKAQEWIATANNGQIYYNYTPTVGRWYRLGVWIKRTAGTSGTVRLSFRQAGNIGWGGFVTDAAYTQYSGAIRARTTDGLRAYLAETGSSDFDTLVIDDYSTREINLASCLAGAKYTPSGDCILKMRMTVVNGFQNGFVANLDSLGNPRNGVFIYAGHWIYDPVIYVDQVVNGVWTNKATIAQSWNANDLLELRKSGTLYSIYRNNTLIGSVTITDPAIIGNTLHAQFSTGGGATTSLWTAEAGTAALFSVYMGGSITQGSSATSEANRYVNLTDTWIKATLTQYTYRGAGFYNAGIGATTSWYGLIRLQTDVIDQNPTVLVLDFAVNDGDADVYRASAEALIRRVRTALPDTRIVAVFFLSVADKDVDDPTNTHDYSYDAWLALCNHYGIPVADYAAGVTAAVQAGTLHLADYFWDTIHPNDAGHAYASTLLQPLMAAALAPGHMSPLPATRIYDNGDYEVTPIARNGTDNDGETGTGWSTVSTTARQSSTADDTITWTGTFSSFGLHSNYSTGAGVLSWRVDGGAWTDRDLSADIQTYRCLWSGVRGSHTVDLKVVSGTVRINRFLAV